MGPSQSLVSNRLLAALAHLDYAALQPSLETISLDFSAVLVTAEQLSKHIYFPESGLVSTLAEATEKRIEIGMIGREGMVGLAAALGTDRAPHTQIVQGAGRALRITTDDFRRAIDERPLILRAIGLYAQALIVQVGQTAYANATATIEARLARWILMTQDRMQSDRLVITHEFLSSMLGVRRPGVTGALHILERIGAVHKRRSRIVVLRREKLMELAGDTYQMTDGERQWLIGEA